MTTMQKVNVLLAQRGLTFSKLAEAIGVSRQSVMNWHKGYKNISSENLQKTAGFLGVDVKTLVDDNTELSFMFPLSEKERLIIDMYRIMNHEQKVIFAEYGLKLMNERD